MTKQEIIAEILRNNPQETTAHLGRLPYDVLEGQLQGYRHYNPGWKTLNSAEIVKELLEGRGNYNVVVHEIERMTKSAWRAFVSYDWRLNAWEKHVSGVTRYMVLTDDGEYRLL